MSVHGNPVDGQSREHLGNVCVLGIGKTGVVVADYLAGQLGNRVDSVTVYGGGKSRMGKEAERLQGRGVRVVVGTEELDGSYDLAVASPGISEFSAFFASAREHASEVIGEPEFAWRESPDRWVAITGTNGKTTTTTLTAELLRADGLSAQTVGNIGTVATGQVGGRGFGTWFVAELSSFQLATTRRLHPRVACLLNVTPDHVEWHKTLQNYAAAKEKVFRNLAASDLAVVSDEDEGIIDAADACDIAATVQANTLKQIIAETLHPVKKAVENAKILEVVAEMNYHALQLTRADIRVPQFLLDKHYYRKHGANAYYGQDNAKSQSGATHH